MRHKGLWLALVVVVLGMWLLRSGSAVLDPGPSVYSKRAGGWMLARHYLEATGAEVDIITRPLGSPADAPAEDPPDPPTELDDGPDKPSETGTAAGVLALAFPWQQAPSDEELVALDRHLRGGGAVLLGTSGRRGNAAEERVLDRLGLLLVSQLDRPPLWLPEWWRLRREGRQLVAPAGTRRPLALSYELGWGAEPPSGARVLYRAVEAGGPESTGGPAVVFDYSLYGGRVVVLPAELLANGRLASAEHGAAHGELLESLRLGLGPVWRFDERHHGLSDRATVATGPHKRSWDLFAAHLLLLYLLAVVTLARGFGPVVHHEVVRSGSVGTFLRGLGALHHRLGHHGAAALQLVERARRVAPAQPWDEAFDRRAAAVGDAEALLALARDIADHQRRRFF